MSEFYFQAIIYLPEPLPSHEIIFLHFYKADNKELRLKNHMVHVLDALLIIELKDHFVSKRRRDSIFLNRMPTIY